MKKLLYSSYTKFAGAVLCVVFITLGALSATEGFIKYCDDSHYIYGFEKSFGESRYINSLLSTVESVLYNSYIGYYREDGAGKLRSGTAAGMTFDEYLAGRLQNLYKADEVSYYVSVNGRVYTNCGAQSADDLKNSRFYRYLSMNGNGQTEFYGSGDTEYLAAISEFGVTDAITVCSSISDENAAKYETEWNAQAEYVKEAFVNVFACALLALLILIYLICVSGKGKNGETKTMWLDLIWTEAHLAFIAAAAVGAIAICVILFDEYQTSHIPVYMLRLITEAAAAAGSAFTITSGLSIVRKIKSKTFTATSIIWRAARWCVKYIVRLLRLIIRAIRKCRDAAGIILSKKSSKIMIVILFVYTAIIGICGVLVTSNGSCEFGLLFGIIVFGAAGFILAYRTKDIDEIRKGAAEIRNGNLDYKIPELKTEDMKALAENINEIGEGLEKTMSAQLKAERLKTDLITNVSHDLKTPLTSIISYTELLSKVQDLPEEAKDYASIIAKKSERLKNLTQDLFEISKVQSGNETFVMEKLDAALLVSQTLGEHDHEIQKSELNFCVNTDKDLFFTADGKKMSRALGNLIDNAIKYSMRGTRVFVSAFETEDDVVLELKNISAYPMDFDAEEITGRFVRGDEARTSEGNGLGLAIAKGYTESCGGRFNVIIDGDLFKVVIRFKKN